MTKNDHMLISTHKFSIDVTSPEETDAPEVLLTPGFICSQDRTTKKMTTCANKLLDKHNHGKIREYQIKNKNVSCKQSSECITPKRQESNAFYRPIP